MLEIIEEPEAKVSNVIVDTVVTRDSFKKRRNTWRDKKKKQVSETQPIPEEVVLDKIKKPAPDIKDTVPEKQMKRIKEGMKTDVKKGMVDFGNNSSQTYASVNKPHKPIVDNSKSSVFQVLQDQE